MAHEGILKKRKALVPAFGAATLVALVAGFSFACTAEIIRETASTNGPFITINPDRGVVRTPVRVDGSRWTPGEVTISWLKGVPVGQEQPVTVSDSGNFSLDTLVPDAATPGYYYVRASQVTPDGTVISERVFEVLATAASAGGGPEPISEVTAQGGAARARGTSPGTTAGAPPLSSSAAAAESVGQANQEVAGTSSQPPQGPSSVSSQSGGSGPGPAQFSNEPGGAPGTGADGSTIPSAARQASRDLWTGFTRESDNVPSITDLPNIESNPFTGQAVSMGILSLGLVALTVAFGAAEVRRRKQPMVSGGPQAQSGKEL